MALDRKLLEAEILAQYLEDDGNRPWILGFSGGKDSTMLLQLVWYTIGRLKETERKRPPLLEKEMTEEEYVLLVDKVKSAFIIEYHDNGTSSFSNVPISNLSKMAA